MEIQEYVNQKKKIYDCLLEFIDCPNELEDEEFSKFKSIVEKTNTHRSRDEFYVVLQIIKFISYSHYRHPEFINRLKKIILYYSDQIKQLFTTTEIYNMFKINNLMLLLFYENGIYDFKEDILNFFNTEYDSYINNKEWACISFFDSFLYFYPEIKDRLSDKQRIFLEELLEENYPSDVMDNFEEKRRKGENESELCELIRNDSIQPFIVYINKKQIKLTSKINPSFFETHDFITIYRRLSLIEYAAFFGSIQIFRYLLQNKVKLTKSLWNYAICGNNPEIIHILESNIKIRGHNFYKCCKLAIKCHHNDVAIYFKDNFIHDDTKVIGCAFKNFNFHLFPNDFNDKYILFYLVDSNYLSLAKLYLKYNKKYLNSRVIL